jgi:hypothetical protein
MIVELNPLEAEAICAAICEYRERHPVGFWEPVWQRLMPIFDDMYKSDAMKLPVRKFSASICQKFPVQTARHVATPANARWMLRNVPLSPFSALQKRELIDFIKMSKAEKE